MTTAHWLIPLGLLIALAGLALLVWALRGDRARGRKRCPRCWYDMAGSPGLTCPECGRGSATERALLRTRRRWRSAALSMFIIAVGLSAAALPRVGRDGWIAATPVPALRLLTAPFPSTAEEEFNKVYVGFLPFSPTTAELTSWQRLLIARHAERSVAAMHDGPTSPEQYAKGSAAWQFLLRNPTEARIATASLRRLLVAESLSGRSAVECLELLNRTGTLRPRDVEWAITRADPFIRTKGARLAAAAAPSPEAAIDLLTRELQRSANVDYRVSVVHMLGGMKGHMETIEPVLIAVERDDPSAQVRFAAALARSLPSDVLPNRGMAQAVHPEHRADMARRVSANPDAARDLLPIMLGLLDDSDPDVRLAAIEALAAYRVIGRHGIDLLHRLAEHDADAQARHAARAATLVVRRAPDSEPRQTPVPSP